MDRPKPNSSEYVSEGIRNEYLYRKALEKYIDYLEKLNQLK